MPATTSASRPGQVPGNWIRAARRRSPHLLTTGFEVGMAIGAGIFSPPHPTHVTAAESKFYQSLTALRGHQQGMRIAPAMSSRAVPGKTTVYSTHPLSAAAGAIFRAVTPRGCPIGVLALRPAMAMVYGPLFGKPERSSIDSFRVPRTFRRAVRPKR